MGSNYEIAYRSEWQKLKKLEILDVASRLEVTYCDNEKRFIIPFLQNNYILDFKNEKIYSIADNSKPSIGDSIAILNYLTFSSDYIINSSKWVTLKEIPNGGALFYPAFYKMSILQLIKNFGDDIEKFEKSCLKLGGVPIKFGDKGYKFKVLPKVDICVALWEGDDEIEANATILFEPSIQHLLHIETIIGIGMSVAEKIVSST